MALLAAGSLANVYQSLDKHIQMTLIDDAGLSVQLHGVRRFVPPGDAAWVTVHYDFLGLQAQHRRQLYGSVFATERLGYLQLNVFQRARIFTQRYTTAAARDTVVGAFPEGSIIEIYDYTGALPDTEPAGAGVLIVDETTETVADTGLESGLIQHVIQVATRYLEHYTRS